MHPRRTFWTGCRQYQPPDEGRPAQRNLLGDEPADREPEEIDLVQAEIGNARNHVARGVRDTGTELAARGPDARVVDQDDLALGRERIGQRRIPVVQIAAEVLEHHQRQLSRAPEPAVGKLHVDELRLSSVVRDRRAGGLQLHERAPVIDSRMIAAYSLGASSQTK